MTVALACLLPFLAYCTLRLGVTGRFGVVSFGGYNLIGVAGQFVDETNVNELPEELQPLVLAALEKRSALDPAMISMPDADRLNYLRMETNYDTTIWHVFTPAAEQHYGGDDDVQNSQLRRLAVEIIRVHPQDYAIWLAKALRQGVRKIAWDFLGNPFGLFVTLLAVGVGLINVMTHRACDPSVPLSPDSVRQAIPALFVIAACYTAAGLGLVILVCPPLGRFTDATAVFLPALVTALLIEQTKLRFSRA